MPPKGSASANVILKVFLIAVNFLFLLSGAVILGVGIYLSFGGYVSEHVRAFNLEEILTQLRPVRITLIACGSVILLVSLCGCIGAYMEKRCLIVLYLLFLLLILIGNASAIGMSYVFKARLTESVSKAIQYSVMRHYGNVSSSAGKIVTEFVDAMQDRDECCGWTGLGTGNNTYLYTPWYSRQQEPRIRYPDSCCAQGIVPNSTSRVIQGKYQQCVNASNEAMARKNGIIRKSSCLDITLSLNGSTGSAVYLSVLVAILLQVVCIAVSVLVLRQITNSRGEMSI